MTKPAQTCINIVADGEIYTAMTDLLIRSILACHSADPLIKIIVGVPCDSDHGLSLAKQSFSDSIEIDRLPISPLKDERSGQQYRHFHKISLFDRSAQRYPYSNHLLLDSDLVLLRSLPLQYLSQFRLAAMPVHYLGWRGDWAELYHSLGLSLQALTLSSSGYECGPAYFNAGFVWASHHVADKLRWSEMALRISQLHAAKPGMHLFPWLDQLALPTAAALLQTNIYELPECMNMLVDKFLIQARATQNDISSFIPSIPYIVHHHRNIRALVELVGNYLPQFVSGKEIGESLRGLAQLDQLGLIHFNKVR